MFFTDQMHTMWFNVCFQIGVMKIWPKISSPTRQMLWDFGLVNQGKSLILVLDMERRAPAIVAMVDIQEVIEKQTRTEQSPNKKLKCSN